MRSKLSLLHIAGLLICVVPPVIATLEYFPLWFSQSETTVSALSAIMLTLCCIPFFKQIKAYLRGTPAAWVIFGIIFLLFSIFNSIADGIENIALVGLISNLCGGALFRIEKHLRREATNGKQ